LLVTTSCAFGAAMKTLFVTSAPIEFENSRWVYMDDAGFAATPLAGGICAIETGIRGLPEPVFPA